MLNKYKENIPIKKTNSEKLISFPKCSEDILNKSFKIMLEGKNPSEIIDWKYQGVVPIFPSDFLNEIVNMLRIYPENGSKFLEYIVNGNSINIQNLNWSEIFKILLNYIPDSFTIIEHCLRVAPEIRLIYIKLDGLTKLFHFSKINIYQKIVSRIFLSLSFERFPDFINNKRKDNILIAVGKDERINFDEEETHVGKGECKFIKFCENLLLSNDLETRINILESFKNQAQINPSLKSLFYNILLRCLDNIEYEEEFILYIETLSISLENYEFYYLGNIFDILRKLIKTTTNMKLIDSICDFIRFNVQKHGGEFGYNLDIIKDLLKQLEKDISFETKKNIIQVLLNVINALPEKLFLFLNDTVFNSLLTFLYSEDSVLISNILIIINKTIEIYSDKLHIYNLIIPYSDIFIQLFYSENKTISEESSKINIFIGNFMV